MKNIQRIKRVLRKQHRFHPDDRSYCVPDLWLGRSGGRERLTWVNPFRFYLDAIERIERAEKDSLLERTRRNDGGEWSRNAFVYNMFIRTTCAFDHNQNGKLDLPTNANGFREVGTFLKAIALLPYIQRLGANTVHLLPITSIGSDGKKGTLGSPYAIKNPYTLDEMLSEPALGLGPEIEFAAFVEAAHRLGIRVVVEFVFRTASKDGDWVPKHPEWFYWIRADIVDREPSSTDESKYGTPLFTTEELHEITAAVAQSRFDAMLPPHPVHRGMFTQPPKPENIRKENGQFIGYLADGTRVRIPGAFADWPPDDVQPPWGDVTYLKLHNHPEFNYMAYNTVRMYDVRLDQPQFVLWPLWEKIIGIIPYFQKMFNIDGVMIDMGHSLPMALKQRIIHEARAHDPDFAFWDENFAVSQKSKEEGYNAVIGFCWIDQHRLGKLKELLRQFERDGFPLPFFATPESHNTPRTAARPGGTAYSKVAWFTDSFMAAIPFIHSGFELGETHPINTGLDFRSDELRQFPSDKLPLFSEFAFDWQRDGNLTDWISKTGALRRTYADLVTRSDTSTFRFLDTGNDAIIAFLRTDGEREILCVANYDLSHRQGGNVSIARYSQFLKDLLAEAFSRSTRREVRTSNLSLDLEPGECLLLTPESHGE